jgi:putative Mg2+ transporter-C (MgtC) family protein
MGATSVLDNPWYINELQIALRLMLAVLLGGMIGFEREQSSHAAGLRTHMMVCLGSCLLMLLSIYGFSAFVDEVNVRVDPARLAAAVITGVGFLGAGTILHTGKGITGLTTAASVWVVSAIGLGVGAGFYFASSVATAMVLFVLWAMNKLERKYIRGKRERAIVVITEDRPKVLGRLQEVLDARGINVRKMSVREEEALSESGHLEVRLQIGAQNQQTVAQLLDVLRFVEGVLEVSTE